MPLASIAGYLSRQTRHEPVYSLDDHGLYELTGALTKAEREAIWLDYVDELSVKEIALRRDVSTGTIKRLLHNGRMHIRSANYPAQEREETMPEKHSIVLPDNRPTIAIHPLPEESFEVDFREGYGYFTVLEIGSKTQWAAYDPPDWRRTYIYNMEVIGKALVHQEECLEIRGDEYEDGLWKENAFRHYIQLTDQYTRYLAVISYRDGVPHLDTFLDERFPEDWGRKTWCMHKDEGRFLIHGNEIITQDSTKSDGAGFFSVMIGKKSFSCLRILDTTGASGENGILVETYLSREGRTALFRRYNGRNWRQESGWLKQAQANQRLIVDGIEYVHWYDCISSFALE